jgi:aminopeptidase N
MTTFEQYLHHKGSAQTGFYNPQVEPQYPPDLELEPVHIDIDAQVDIVNEQADCRVTTTLFARGEAPQELILDAVDFENISVGDPDGHELTFHYDGQKLAVRWADPISRGERRRVEITYQVIKPVDGLFFSQPNEAYPTQPWYAATDHETERARHWLPCIDLPNVRTTLDFHLRAESHFTILANGYLVEEISHDDGTKTAHWRLDQLCPSYLICFAIGDFVHADDGVFNDGEKDIPLAYFCSRDHTAEDLMRTFGDTGAMMAWMTEKLAMPFPYPKYYQFALPLLGGAMENISLVSWSDRMIQDETAAPEFGWWVDQVNVHEMAHSYFGDAIVCRDFAHAWLKESWATYIPHRWLEETRSAAESAYRYYLDSNRYFREADTRYQRPIVTRHFESSWQMYDGHLYPGGACRLHTLCNELGEDVFWTAVRDYLRRYDGKVVETDHFRHVMEEHSGRSLGPFFDQWFYTAGYPSLKVSFNYDAKNKQGSFEVEQQQVDQEKAVPVFLLTTDLGWTIDGRSYRLPVKLDREKQTFIVDMAAEPEQVRFDPDNKVLHKLSFNPGGPMLRTQLADAPDVIGRIQAARELVKTGKRSNIQAVVDAYANESFWGVRVEMAQALSKANSETAVAGLAQIVTQEQDPMAMASVFRAAGQYRDTRIKAALLSRLQEELPYAASSAAYEALGEQRQEAPLHLLLEASSRDSFNGVVQSGALRGLASTRQPEALDPLLEHVIYGSTANNARPAAVSALAEIGQGQEKARREQIIERLTDLLRDPWYYVHRAAAFGLGRVEAPEAIPDLQAYARRVTHQDEVDIEEIIHALRATDKVDGSVVKKQVEELRDKIRKLENRVEKLAAKVDQEPAAEIESTS